MSSAEHPTAKAAAAAVVIPTFNYGQFVGRAIQSALDQTEAPAEVVVVDDGSTDDTVAVVAEFGSAVTLIRQENRGVAAARNAGVRATAAPILAFLDADDAWHPRKLERQLRRLADEPRLGLVHCGVDKVDSTGAVVDGQDEGAQGWVAEDLLLLEGPGILGGGSGAIVPRAVFEEVGGFDERMSTSADWDLWLRIAMRYPVGFVPDRLVRYSLHGANMHNNLDAMEREVLLAYDKAFTATPALARRRSLALANLYLTLSGSHLAAGRRLEACRCAAQCLRHRPAKATYILGLPLRRLDARRPPARRA